MIDGLGPTIFSRPY